jgi:hypothetical protein
VVLRVRRDVGHYCSFWDSRSFIITGQTFWPTFPSELLGGCHLVSRIYLHLICHLGLGHLICSPPFQLISMPYLLQ